MMELNKIYCKDVLEFLNELDNDSVDCVVTSPPYNKGYWSKNRNINNGFHTKSRKIVYGNFDDKLDPNDYQSNQRRVLNELVRIIKPTGSIFYNHIDILTEHCTIHPTFIYEYAIKQIIIWNRNNTPKLDVSYFYPVTEYIYWIKKNKNSKPLFFRENCFFKKNIWDIPPESKNVHPAPFPVSLAYNCISATCKEGSVVLDCYMGSGTTAIAAIKHKCNFLGCDNQQCFVDMANNRIELEKRKLSLF